VSVQLIFNDLKVSRGDLLERSKKMVTLVLPRRIRWLLWLRYSCSCWKARKGWRSSLWRSVSRWWKRL